MNELLDMGSRALRKAALAEEAKEYILQNDALFNRLKKAANRYIGGETLAETVAKVNQQNQAGFKCSIEFMGENTRTADEAIEATQEFIRIAKTINEQNLYATISLDLSHIGLSVSRDLCLQNLDRICRQANESHTEVIISAEDVDKTDQVLDVYRRAEKVHPNLAITLQAYLHRTKDDFKEVFNANGRIRMVKGAFETPKGLSLPRGETLDNAYLDYVQQLLVSQHRCSIATHHDRIQQEAKGMIERYQTSRDVYEFESLYGIQPEQLHTLKEEGHPAKVYFVYGREWYLYLCNRLAEYPLNLFRALHDIVE